MRLWNACKNSVLEASKLVSTKTLLLKHYYCHQGISIPNRPLRRGGRGGFEGGVRGGLCLINPSQLYSLSTLQESGDDGEGERDDEEVAAAKLESDKAQMFQALHLDGQLAPEFTRHRRQFRTPSPHPPKVTKILPFGKEWAKGLKSTKCSKSALP